MFSLYLAYTFPNLPVFVLLAWLQPEWHVFPVKSLSQEILIETEMRKSGSCHKIDIYLKSETGKAGDLLSTA